MLKIGGIVNIIIAIAHLIGLLWAEQMFETTGIKEEMVELAKIHFILPYALTLFVAIVFFVFGLYGLSAAGMFKKLPFLKLGIFVIAFVYLFRGFGELFFTFFKGTLTSLEATQSIVAILIGSMFLFGGLKKWKRNELMS